MRSLGSCFWYAVALALFCCQGAAQQSAPAVTQQQPPAQPKADAAANPGPEAIANAREALRKAEADHPRNTKEVADALRDLVSLQVDTGTADAATLGLAGRWVQLEEALEGPRSKPFVDALSVQADILLGLNRAPDARLVAERALEIGQKEFSDAQETGTAAGALGHICTRLGDYPCAIRAYEVSVGLARKSGPNSPDLLAALNNMGTMKGRTGDIDGAIKAQEEALAIGYRLDPTDLHFGVIENNLGANYLKVQDFDRAAKHLNRAVEMLTKLYGAESQRLMQVSANLAELYTRTGQFPLARKAFEFSLKSKYGQIDAQAAHHAQFAQSLAEGGDPARAVDEGLVSARLSREIFVLQARTLPERQALAYDAARPHGLDTAISVAIKHPDLSTKEIYQEVVSSRALVADEMARRQKNQNAGNDPEVARQLKELNQARADLLALQQATPGRPGFDDAVVAATSRMEKIERSLAERSADLRNDERVAAVRLDELRHTLPPQSVLISYVTYRHILVDKVDPALSFTPAYMAFVMHPESERIGVFDLGDAKPIEDLVARARAAADAEAHSSGLGSIRNERNYRAAGDALRRLAWDPLQKELAGKKLALVVADGVLNLIPFSSLPEGSGYLVEHGPVIHMLSSERDMVATDQRQQKQGLFAIGSPTFEMAGGKGLPAALRSAGQACDTVNDIQFQPLPGTATEVSDIGSLWKKWNGQEHSQIVTGNDATLPRFLDNAPESRVLHIATHAFLLDKSCGNGNPLLHSGLVFAGDGHGAAQSILTAQQIASVDLVGVDWAVLSACNTGNGELHDGEGVLGLERAFRVAGARSVIMTLWPVDDDVTQQFMHELYAQRLAQHASTADAVWNSARKLLRQRRAGGKSTHPWYWAGFVGSGGWQ